MWTRRAIAAEARGFPVTGGAAEEIVALGPDLVLTSRYAFVVTRHTLARLGVRAEAFGTPATLAESLGEVARVGVLVGRPERGRALVTAIREAVARAAPPPGAPRLSALVFQGGGFASAPGTLMDEMLRRTGFDNAAARYGLERTGPVPLERLLADPPDVLLAGQRRPGAPTWADRVLEHPALRGLEGRVHRAVFPQRLLNCGGPVLIEAAAALARAREDALARRT